MSARARPYRVNGRQTGSTPMGEEGQAPTPRRDGLTPKPPKSDQEQKRENSAIRWGETAFRSKPNQMMDRIWNSFA